MAEKTYFGSRLRAGSDISDTATGIGDVVLSQTTTVTSTADGLAASATLVLPANAQIINYFVDTIVAPVAGGGTATTAPVTVGSAAAGAQYMTSTDLFTTARSAAALTVAQVAAMDDIGTNTTVYLTVDPNGTISTTQGVWRLTANYAMRS